MAKIGSGLCFCVSCVCVCLSVSEYVRQWRDNGNNVQIGAGFQIRKQTMEAAGVGRVALTLVNGREIPMTFVGCRLFFFLR